MFPITMKLIFVCKDASTLEEYLDRYSVLSRLKLSQVTFDGHKTYSVFRLKTIQALLSLYNVFSPDLCRYNPRTKVLSYNFLLKYQIII